MSRDKDVPQTAEELAAAPVQDQVDVLEVRLDERVLELAVEGLGLRARGVLQLLELSDPHQRRRSPSPSTPSTPRPRTVTATWPARTSSTSRSTRRSRSPRPRSSATATTGSSPAT